MTGSSSGPAGERRRSEVLYRRLEAMGQAPGIEMDQPKPTDDLLSKIAAGEPIPGSLCLVGVGNLPTGEASDQEGSSSISFDAFVLRGHNRNGSRSHSEAGSDDPDLAVRGMEWDHVDGR
jgi:hypothetical protein